jgi:cation transport regulator ChaB
MPYARNSELPPAVREAYSERCQTVFRKAFNATDGDEALRFKFGHTAAKNCEQATRSEKETGVGDSAKSLMTVKFAEGSDTIIEGYGVPFGLDLDGQQFSAKSDLCLDWFPNGGRPILYQHGFDKAIKMAPIGREIESTLTDDGLWVRAELDKASKYYERIKPLIEAGAVGWSSGAPDHKVKVAQDGHIDLWPSVEFSLTPTPAKPNLVAYAMKSEQAAGLMPADIEQTQGDPEPESLAEQSEQVLAGLKAWAERMEERSDFRVKFGRELSKANIESLREAHKLIGALLERADAPSEDEADAAKKALELALAITG